MTKRAFVFPGQGSQAVGMGLALSQAFAPAREVFEEVDDALDQSLSRLMFEGPDEDLRLTENAQPALMAVSLAVVRVIEREGGKMLASACSFVAGHSLGEYSALSAAGTFSLADAARLLRTRGRAMQQAVPVGEGAMAALLGLDLEAARAVAEDAAEGDVCQTANDNAPGQVVVSGTRAAVERAVALAAERGAKRSIILPVSAPFHCALMEPAARAMAEALATVKMTRPSVPLVGNVVASALIEVDAIRARLVDQVTGMVRWRESMLYLKDQGVEEIVELGAGKVLSGLARRIDPDLKGSAVNGPADIEALFARL